MLTLRHAVLAICILMAASLSAWSQQQAPNEQSLQAEIAEWQRASTAMGAELQSLQVERDSGYFDVVKSYNASIVDHYAYQAELRDHGRSVLSWQLFSPTSCWRWLPWS